MNDINQSILYSQIRKIDSVGSSTPARPVDSGASKGSSFEEILGQSELQFSKHAEKRLQSRHIQLSSEDLSQLTDAVGSLQKKGAQDSLVLMKELAFIVNVPSRTVVTAMAKDQMKEQVFTNIDSTILV